MAAFLAPLAITGISALASALANRRKQSTSTQQQNSTSTSTQNFDIQDRPLFGAEQQTGIGVGLNSLINRAMAAPDLSGYEATGRRALGENLRARESMTQRLLASRGLSYSPAAAAITARGQDEEYGNYFNFLSGIPLLRDKLQGESARDLISAVAAIPTGTSRTGSTTTNTSSTGNVTGTTTQPGDVLGGLFSGLGQGLAGTLGYRYHLNELMKRYNLNPGSTPDPGWGGG